MKIMVLGSVSPEHVAAIQAECPQVEVTSSNPFFGLATASTSSFDVAVVDWRTAGELPQPFEHLFGQVVVVDTEKGKAELREYSPVFKDFAKAGADQYAIHTERFPVPVSASLDMRLFTTALVRSVDKNPSDLRQAIRWGVKAGLRLPQEAVQSILGG
jgi:hypothetical protein